MQLPNVSIIALLIVSYSTLSVIRQPTEISRAGFSCFSFWTDYRPLSNCRSLHTTYSQLHPLCI